VLHQVGGGLGFDEFDAKHKIESLRFESVNQ
jgi:hypothetical protein